MKIVRKREFMFIYLETNRKKDVIDYFAIVIKSILISKLILSFNHDAALKIIHMQ